MHSPGSFEKARPIFSLTGSLDHGSVNRWLAGGCLSQATMLIGAQYTIVSFSYSKKRLRHRRGTQAAPTGYPTSLTTAASGWQGLAGSAPSAGELPSEGQLSPSISGPFL